jgi:hypothetical protein
MIRARHNFKPERGIEFSDRTVTHAWLNSLKFTGSPSYFRNNDEAWNLVQEASMVRESQSHFHLLSR